MSIVRKFFTKEDTLHVHKILGSGALLHFIYRFYNICVYNDARFTLAHTPLFIFLHMALSGTSMLFHVPSNRVTKRPMIYREFRLHSIVFAYRSLFVMLILHYFPGPASAWFRALVVLGTFLCADWATLHYKPQHTTMRDMPFSDWVPPLAIKSLNCYYSVSQVLATMNMIIRPSMDVVFMTVFPIQIAAFLMTCVRKGVLSADGWHILYALSLGLNYWRGYYVIDGGVRYDYWAMAAAFCVLRFGWRVNKYMLWAPILLYSVLYY